MDRFLFSKKKKNSMKESVSNVRIAVVFSTMIIIICYFLGFFNPYLEYGYEWVLIPVVIFLWLITIGFSTIILNKTSSMEKPAVKRKRTKKRKKKKKKK